MEPAGRRTGPRRHRSQLRLALPPTETAAASGRSSAYRHGKLSGSRDVLICRDESVPYLGVESGDTGSPRHHYQRSSNGRETVAAPWRVRSPRPDFRNSRDGRIWPVMSYLLDRN